jgi:hypothetical protein
MSYSPEEVEHRAQRYAVKHGLSLVDRLGFGVHGVVWATDRESAIKVHALDQPHYERERDIYLRLFQLEVTLVHGCHVPQLVDCDNKLKVIEIGIVQPPFVLDFAGAYLDEEPDFSPEVWAEWEGEKREQFGDDWPRAQTVVAALKGYGIFMSDVTPNNIRFR